MDLKHPDAESGAVKTIENFMAYLNSEDNAGLYDTIHIPHVRISGNGVRIYNNFQELRENYLQDFRDRAGDSWHHTVLDSTEILHSSASKVHVYIQWTRYDAMDLLLATHKALWILTKVDGRWGVQARSSFAP